jgi:dipeptidyl aminopeptidase/acylaminoacyl peptidase
MSILRPLLLTLVIGLLSPGWGSALGAQPAQETPSPPGSVAAPAPSGTPFTSDDFFRLRAPSLQALSPDGRWAFLSHVSQEGRLGIDNHRFGDPTYVAPVVGLHEVVDTRTGEARALFSGERQVEAAAWAPDGETLALVLRQGGPAEAVEGAPFDLAFWEVASGRIRTARLPADRVLAPAAGDLGLRWLPDGSGVVFPMYAAEWEREARERFLHEVHGPIVVRSSANDFLSWEAIRRMGLTRSLGVARVGNGAVEELLEETSLAGWELTRDGAWIRLELDITEGTDYDRIFGRDHRVVLRRLHHEGSGVRVGEEEREILANDRGLTLRWSGDGGAWAWRDGDRLLFQSLELDDPRELVGAGGEGDADAEDSPADGPAGEAADDDDARAPRLTPVRLNGDGSLLVASSDQGLWLVQTDSGERTLFLEQDPDDETSPRWSVVAWEEEGDRIHLSYGSRTEWEWGLHRYDPATGNLEELVRDGRRWTGFTLSEDGSRAVVQVAEAGLPGEWFAGDPDLGGLQPLTDANPWLRDRALGEVELLRYLDVDGKTLHGILHTPPDFDPRRAYPTVFVLYETFFDPTFNATAALLNAEGYLVVQPSVNLVQGYPGEAWLKGVTAAANQLVDRGIADPDRLGIQGVSYGGYAVSLLVAQTPRFAAAINISGKTNMVSFYTDSPRLATRNTHAPERSQDRIGGTLWEEPLKYLAHSAVMAADRITTPLLLLTGQQDHNVTERTTSEMYYALRRLGREVEWVSYIDGGHGMPRSTRAEAEDYLERMLEWYERHMPAPGVMADDGLGEEEDRGGA